MRNTFFLAISFLLASHSLCLTPLNKVLQNPEELNLSEGLEMLYNLSSSIKSMQMELKYKKAVLEFAPNSLQADAMAGIAAISAGLDVLEKGLNMYEKYFNKFFDTTQIKEASAYLEKNKARLYEVANQATADALTGISTALMTMVDIRHRINNMTQVLIDASDNVVMIYDDLQKQT